MSEVLQHVSASLPAILSLPDTAQIKRGELPDPYLAVLQDIADSLRRMAEVHAPVPREKVDTSYVAERLGYTTVYVAQMARDGIIPKSCLVPGTGNGRQWKFYRERIEQWIERR